MSKPKFKPGDKVIILDGSKIEGYVGCWNKDGMGQLVGKICTITTVDARPDNRNGYYMKETSFIFDERGLAPFAGEKILVYRDKTNTLRVLAKDLTTGKTAEARCNPADKFDFNVGATLAFSRLVTPKSPKPVEEKPAPQFEVGDVIIPNDDAEKRYTVTRGKWIGVVVENTDGGGIVAKTLGTGTKHWLDSACFNLISRSGKTCDVVCVKTSIDWWTLGKTYKMHKDVVLDDEGMWHFFTGATDKHGRYICGRSLFVPLIKDGDDDGE